MSGGEQVIGGELAEVRSELAALAEELKHKSDEYVELKRREADLIEAKRALKRAGCFAG